MSKKNRWLVQTLILSALLNVALVGVFFYFLIRDNPLHFHYQPKVEVKAENRSLNSTFVARLQTLSFEELVELLSDQQMVGQGYRVRDFAAAALVKVHAFDLRRALGNRLLSERRWDLGDQTLTLYPGLTEEDCADLALFARTERFPFKVKKLLEKIDLEQRDPELLAYFCHTPEFILVETLFVRTQLPISKGTLLNLVCEGGWERLARFVEAQQQQSDFSDLVRREFLLDYVAGASKTAAYLLLITDFDFALNQLDDHQMVSVLQLLDVKTQEAMHFMQALSTSLRSEAVCQQAVQRLAEFGEEEVAGRYVPRPSVGQLRPVFRESPPAAPAPSMHLVQPGESLWLIAQKYRVPVELLMEVNGLHSTVIQPGKSLQIPLSD
ncbi:MAG: hypothetical protein S4CHLAM2_09970 [Chlamydiales bacterium]|nr:hypothetical protein [Chlamydiales bacterium]